MPLDRGVYFECVRKDPFGGHMEQQQVDGQAMILDTFEKSRFASWDRRWVGYALATTMHETASTMWPIEEYGKGAGMAYGVPDAETGQTYYGRGFVQLTWRDNYARADKELRLGHEGSPLSCEWNAKNALNPMIAAATMFKGMQEGWFRGDALEDFFNSTDDDPYSAREIINGDKAIVPSWSGGVPIGNIIADYYMDFTAALNNATKAAEEADYADELLRIVERHE
jgi:putative chitinase